MVLGPPVECSAGCVRFTEGARSPVTIPLKSSVAPSTTIFGMRNCLNGCRSARFYNSLHERFTAKKDGRSSAFCAMRA